MFEKMTLAALARAYNTMATALGNETVNRFPNKEAGIRRCEEIRTMVEQNGNTVVAEGDNVQIVDTGAKAQAREAKKAEREAAKVAKAEQAAAAKAEKEAAKTAKEAEREAAKEAKKAERAAAKSAGTETSATPRSPGRPRRFTGATLVAKVEKNPRREGTIAGKSIQIIIDNPGIAYEDFIKAGGRLKDLEWDLDKKYVEAHEPKAQAA